MEGAPSGPILAVPGALTELFILCGLAGHIRSDNGQEFMAQAARDWFPAVGAKTAIVEPEPLWEKGFCEGLDSRFCFEISLRFARRCQTSP